MGESEGNLLGVAALLRSNRLNAPPGAANSAEQLGQRELAVRDYAASRDRLCSHNRGRCSQPVQFGRECRVFE
jgi:hypothetical protein